MNKILGIYLGAFCWLYSAACYAADKFEILPDLPEPLASAAQASSVTTTDAAPTAVNTAQAIGHEPNLVSLVFSLLFVILLIYATGIIYTKLNKLGFATMKKQMGNLGNSRVAIVSTTPIGNNKSLHVIELDGKRMLIGAAANSINLIKDLGNYTENEEVSTEYSKIEIPNIRIPKIEIPKIEFPGFTKIMSNGMNVGVNVGTEKEQKASDTEQQTNLENDESFEISEIYEEENPDGIIDKLFHTATDETKVTEEKENEHKVDPDEFALYKKYLS